MAFVHLHTHTQYSLLDGAARIKELIHRASEYEIPAIAITDHGNMYGVLDFYEEAKKVGIKPIIGMEAYVINGSIHSDHDKKKQRYHLTLLVKDLNGYHNLTKLSTIAFLDGFYYKPRLDKKLLKKYAGGLIALSGCMQGEISQLILANNYEKAKKVVQTYKEIFGKDNFYLEIMRLGIQEEEKVNTGLIKLSQETDTPLVCTNDIHYLSKDDSDAHDVLLCIQTGKKLSDESRMKFNTDQIYFKSESEMQELFHDIPEAVENTVCIADQCNLEIRSDKFLLPKVEIPPQYSDMDEYLHDITIKAIDRKYGSSVDREKIMKRVDYELKIIKDTGFAGYFLVTRDIVAAAREMGVLVGPGRGSAAGSIIAYLTDITRIDPLKYDLIFERFLNPERISMPDIDIDFSAAGRGKVIAYIVEKYGRENVSQIITFGTLGAKMVVRDVGRVMGLPQDEIDRIAKMIPGMPGITLSIALKTNPELYELINSKEEYTKLMKYALSLEGLLRHSGVHAAGLVIAPDNLVNYVPLAKNVKEDCVVTQYEGTWLEKLKLLKLDCLGLKNLTIIEKTLELIKQNYNTQIDIDSIDLNDINTYELLCKGDTDGVFQFESAGMRNVLIQIKPNCIEDLAVCTALYRPGPLDSGMHQVYIRRKNNEEKVTYLHPLLEEILRPTYGVIIYQEQAMQIANRLAGFSLSEADILRKAMGKKQKRVMNKMKPKFIEGAVNNGIEQETAEEIFALIEKFGHYGFNKSHSVAYSIISYQTAYLKANFPAEFMAALMSVEEDNEKIARFIEDCQNMGIQVIPPDVNKSGYDFSVQDENIIFGLKAIKNVGQNAANALVKARNKYGKFHNIFEFAEKVDLSHINKSTVESLIGAGAMDSLEGNRAQKYILIESALKYGLQKNSERAKGQSSLFEDSSALLQNSYPSMPDLKDWDLSYKLQKEKELLGIYTSGNPLMPYKVQIDCIKNFSSSDYNRYQAGDSKVFIPEKIRMFGIITGVSKKVDKKNNIMAFLDCECFEDKFEVIVFSSKYPELSHWLEKNNIVYIEGTLSEKEFQDHDKLRIIADKIIPIEELPEKLSGDIYFEMDEEAIDSIDYNSLIKSCFQPNRGNFRVHFKIKTKNFGELHIASQKYNIFPDRKLSEALEAQNNLIKISNIQYKYKNN